MNPEQHITTEKIIHPYLEEEVEVIVIEFPETALKVPPGKEFLRKRYIHLETGLILGRSFTDTDWTLYAPIPFNRQLHERLKENNYKSASGRGLYIPDESKPRFKAKPAEPDPSQKMTRLEDIDPKILAKLMRKK